jgi:drug/metabolite transporter (DMT)-like permease
VYPIFKCTAMKNSYLFVILLLALLWGGAFVFLEIAIEGLAPVAVVYFRVLLASATLFVAARVCGERFPAGWRIWGRYAVLGLLGNVIPFLLIAWAQRMVAPGVTSTVCATTPVFTMMILCLSGSGERLTRSKLGSLLLGLSGVVLLMAKAPESVMGLAGAGAALLAAVSYAAAAVYGKRFDRESPLINAAAMLGCSTLILSPCVLGLSGGGFEVPALRSVVAVICLAEVSTAGGFLLYFHILRTHGPLRSSWISFLVPIGTVLLAAVLLRQFPEPRTLLAVGAVLGGLLLLNREKRAAATGGESSEKLRSEIDSEAGQEAGIAVLDIDLADEADVARDVVLEGESGSDVIVVDAAADRHVARFETEFQLLVDPVPQTTAEPEADLVRAGAESHEFDAGPGVDIGAAGHFQRIGRAKVGLGVVDVVG